MRGKQRTATVTTDGNTVDKITIYFPSQRSVVTSRQTELDNVLYVSDVLYELRMNENYRLIRNLITLMVRCARRNVLVVFPTIL